MTKIIRAPCKIDYGPCKIKKLCKCNDLLQKYKTFFETNSVFEKAYKFQWKNAHSTVLQNASNQKNQHFQ